MSNEEEGLIERPCGILVADDHPFVCRYIEDFCRKKWPDASVRSANSFEEAATVLAVEKVDLFVTDYAMPAKGGREGVVSILEDYPDLKVIVFSGAASGDDAAYLLRKGVAAYFPKAGGVQALERVFDLVLMGETYAPAQIVSKADSQQVLKDRGIAVNLSERELRLLAEFSKGMSNKRIAPVLGLSESMVKQVARGVFRKLDVSTRAQAVASALQMGLIRLDEGEIRE